eukprot:5102407-Prymnesium_polylepis.2
MPASSCWGLRNAMPAARVPTPPGWRLAAGRRHGHEAANAFENILARSARRQRYSAAHPAPQGLATSKSTRPIAVLAHRLACASEPARAARRRVPTAARSCGR